MGKQIDLAVQRFGRLTVLEPAGKGSGGKIMWRCRCDCGNTKIVYAGNLRSGGTVSCGCFKRENARANKPTHGGKGTRLYNIWRGMKTRCINATDHAYERYGGRGITICAEWANSFEAFRDWALANGYRDDLTIDREDNDGPYSPDNCRWATAYQQNNNRSINRMITYNSETHTLAQWSRLTGIKEDTIRKRMKRGWSAERALTTKTRR